MKRAKARGKKISLYWLFMSTLGLLGELAPSEIYEVMRSLQSDLVREGFRVPLLTLERFAKVLNKGLKRNDIEYRNGVVSLTNDSQVLAETVLKDLRFQIQLVLDTKEKIEKHVVTEIPVWEAENDAFTSMRESMSIGPGPRKRTREMGVE